MTVFAAYDATPAPLAGLTPTWVVVYDVVLGTPLGVNPTFTDLGLGLYIVNAGADEDTAGIIDLGATAVPRYLLFDSESQGSFAAFDSAGAPLTGLTPTWDAFVDELGVAAAAPTITELAGGLYRINYTGPDIRTGLLNLGATADPRYYSYTYDPAGPGDTAAPTIANMVPAPGAITRTSPIDFDVTDLAPGLLRVIVTLKYASEDETIVIHDGVTFVAPFNGSGNVRSAIANGYHFTLLAPGGGWSEGFDLSVLAIDGDGNLV